MYQFSEIQKKWNKYWEDNQTFKTDVWDFSKPKYYVLDMFPYPSAEGLHVGHPEGYTATDIVARMKRMQGYNVLHPMGFDSYGLPAEQYAIKTGNHPGKFTEKNAQNFVNQLQNLGFSYDWSKQISTADPSFFKWTQWIFKQLFTDGLAKNIDTTVNWCEELGTVLANDEIVDGKSERGGFPVVKKVMKQWVIDIPKYAERLLAGLENLDWPNSTKEMQRNWIGKSEGTKIVFNVAGSEKSFEVFTTRPDTIFGATYCVLAPEHELVKQIATPEQLAEVNGYIAKSAAKSDLERTDLNKDKSGVFTGAYAINPLNGKHLPIYISDYVLVTYGTGAIMAVPAHDERDYEFAKKYNIDIVAVLDGGDITQSAFTGDGPHINSGFIDGLNKADAICKINEWLEKNNVGFKTITYRLREWIFARQRYWGEPLPIVHLQNGNTVALTDDELPLLLPDLEDYSPHKDGSGALARATEWLNVSVGGVKGKREINTMPGSAGSSWYYMRYIDPHNDKAIADEKLLSHWLPVDLYIGGAEHAVGHLLYSRMFTKYLYDKGIVRCDEPFKKLVHQGMILGENGIKMSKSLGNVVNPDDIVAEYGTDAFRLFEMFMGPLEAAKPWNTGGMSGAKKFLDRVWRILVEDNKISDKANVNLDKVYNETVKKVTEDYEALGFNTAISQLMILLNAFSKEDHIPLDYAKGYVLLLSPVAPYICEEMWQLLFGATKSLAFEPWPTYDTAKIKSESYELIVQVNGKVKVVLNIDNTLPELDVKQLVSNNEIVKAALADKQIVKEVFIAKRLMNFVVR